jgi:hypothetical protein
LTRLRLVPLALPLLLSACSFADETLWPTLAGESPRGVALSAMPRTEVSVTGRTAFVAPSTVQEVPAMPGAAAPPAAGVTAKAPPPSTFALSGPSADLATELTRVRQQVANRELQANAARGALQDSVREYETAAGTGARAGEALAKRSQTVGRLAALAALTAGDSTSAGTLAQVARTAATQPGVSEAERARLAIVERGAVAAAADSDRLIAELGSVVAAENRQLAALGDAPIRMASTAAAPVPRPAERRALVTIRFERPDTPYGEELDYAVREALRRRPNASFDVVAAAPPGGLGAAAKRNVEGVVRRLAALGVPVERLTLSATTRPGAAGDEVQVFVR